MLFYFFKLTCVIVFLRLSVPIMFCLLGETTIVYHGGLNQLHMQAF